MSAIRDYFTAILMPDAGGKLRGVGIIAKLVFFQDKKGNDQSRFKHYYVKTLDEAISKAKGLDINEEVDVYCALSLFKDVNQNENSGNRTGAKAIGAGSFWLDIDVGEKKALEGKGYATPEEADAALRAFCHTTDLPKPSLFVCSGYGLHVYWLMNEFVPRERWLAAARKLKALTIAHKFLADQSRTADIASVLRPVGTRNFKDRANPQPVTVLYPDEDKPPKRIDLTKFEAALDAALAAFPGAQTGSLVGSISPRAAAAIEGNLQRDALSPPTPERLQSAIDATPVDLSYEEWRDFIWGGLNSGVPHAVDRLRKWSQRSKQWETVYKGMTGEQRFAQIVADFDPSRDEAKGVGSLFRIARAHGWTPPNEVTVAGKGGALDGQIIGPGSAAPGQLATRDDFNGLFFVAPLGGGTFIFDRTSENLIAEGMTEAAFKLRFKNLYDKESDPEDKKSSTLATQWLSWTKRKTYDRVVFDPSGAVREGEYNSWRGLTIKPIESDCTLIWEHIRDVLCGGNGRVFNYVIKWLALLVQRPWEKPGVALVMKSREGAGKSLIAQLLLGIFGQHGFTTASKDAVAGRFNAHLYDKVLVVLEEAFFAGDPSAVAKVKELITNDTISYEAKGKDVTIGRNYAHVMFLTNHDWAVSASEDARRYMVLDVSDARIGERAYFNALLDEIRSGGVEAFLDYLLNIDLTGFNPRKRPETLALADQRKQTLLNDDPIKAWWMGALVEGEFQLREGALNWGASVDAVLLRQSYEHATIRRAPRAPPFHEAMKAVQKLVPAGSLTKHRPRGGNTGRRHVYSLPLIEEARAKFREQTGVEIVADDASDE